MMMYADPGSGVLIWQLLIALFFGAAFYFSRLRTWVTAKLRPARNEHQQSEPVANQESFQGE